MYIKNVRTQQVKKIIVGTAITKLYIRIQKNLNIELLEILPSYY